jgi:hypothetical protein
MPTKKKTQIKPNYTSLAWYMAPLQSKSFARLGKKVDQTQSAVESLQSETNELKRSLAAIALEATSALASHPRMVTKGTQSI